MDAQARPPGSLTAGIHGKDRRDCLCQDQEDHADQEDRAAPTDQEDRTDRADRVEWAAHAAEDRADRRRHRRQDTIGAATEEAAVCRDVSCTYSGRAE